MAAATRGKRGGAGTKRKTSAKAKTAGSTAKKAKAEVPDPVSRGANAAASAAHAAKGTMAAGRAVGSLTSLVRKPLIIGAAAAAGVAGGVALSKRAGR